MIEKSRETCFFLSLSINLSTSWQTLKSEGRFSSNLLVGVLGTVERIWRKSVKKHRELNVYGAFEYLFSYMRRIKCKF